MKKVFIRGNEERGSEVIKMLEELDGVNGSCLKGTSELRLYYVNKDNQIKYVLPESESGIIIQECFKELYLPKPTKELPNTWKEWVEQNSKNLITLKIKNLGDGSVLITKMPYEEYKEIED